MKVQTRHNGVVPVKQNGFDVLTWMKLPDARWRSGKDQVAALDRGPILQIVQQTGRWNGHPYDGRRLADFTVNAKFEMEARRGQSLHALCPWNKGSEAGRASERLPAGPGQALRPSLLLSGPVGEVQPHSKMGHLPFLTQFEHKLDLVVDFTVVPGHIDAAACGQASVGLGEKNGPCWTGIPKFIRVGCKGSNRAPHGHDSPRWTGFLDPLMATVIAR